jgi:hypothetical protein
MKQRHYLSFLTILCFFLTNCSDNSSTATHSSSDSTAQKIILSDELAAKIFSLPIHCLEVEYPNKLGQVLGSKSDLKTPKQLRPIFYGCFDWHSSVHGYWSIVELLQQFPDLDRERQVRTLLNHHITPENVATEISFFNDPNNLSFELQESLHKWDDPDARKWKENLQPLVDLLVARYEEYLPKLVYPIRTGQHDNSAFGLSLSLDYARTVQDENFENSIIEHAKRLFKADNSCPLAYEPSGYDFLSPCLEEAYLMAKVMEDTEYQKWLKNFIPSLFDQNFDLEPAVVKDRTDGKLVHLDGLNYSRAACLYGIAASDTSTFAHLNNIANKHIAFSLPNLSKEDDYMGSHWLGTFALYALSHTN